MSNATPCATIHFSADVSRGLTATAVSLIHCQLVFLATTPLCTVHSGTRWSPSTTHSWLLMLRLLPSPRHVACSTVQLITVSKCTVSPTCSLYSRWLRPELTQPSDRDVPDRKWLLRILSDRDQMLIEASPNFKSIGQRVWRICVPKIWCFPLTLIMIFTAVWHIPVSLIIVSSSVNCCNEACICAASEDVDRQHRSNTRWHMPARWTKRRSEQPDSIAAVIFSDILQNNK